MKESAIPSNDFADWLSPMLVKELRQGLRTRIFVLTFVALQVLMTLCVVVGLVASTGDPGNDMSALHGFFWFLLGLVLLAVIPLTGLNALSSEVRANTLELIFLTRLSAWRIVWGKWVAIIAQTTLLVCAILPYFVLRYFMGGVNIATDLIILGVMVAASLVITAATVAISAYPNIIARIVMALGMLMIFLMLPSFSIAFTMGRMSAGSMLEWSFFLFLAGFVVLFIPLMLQIGTGFIAPPSENHSALARIVCLAFFALACLARITLFTPEPVIFIALLACGLAIFVAVSEREQTNLSIYRPFVRRGFLGRLVGRIFYAGWPAGVVFSALLITAFVVLMFSTGSGSFGDNPVAIMGIAGTVAFGAALIRVVFPRRENVLGIFIVIILFGILIAMLAGVSNNALDIPITEFACFYPPAAFFLGLGDLSLSYEGGVPIVGVTTTTVISVVVVFVYLVGAWKRMAQLERAAMTGHDEVA